MVTISLFKIVVIPCICIVEIDLVLQNAKCIYIPIRLFGVAMSPRNASHRSRQAYRGPKRHLTNAGVNIRHIYIVNNKSNKGEKFGGSLDFIVL